MAYATLIFCDSSGSSSIKQKGGWTLKKSSNFVSLRSLQNFNFWKQNQKEIECQLPNLVIGRALSCNHSVYIDNI